MIDVNLIDGFMSYYKQLRIKDGKFTEKFGSDLMRWVSAQPDMEVELSVAELDMAKTNKQNKYFNGVLVPVFRHKTGSTDRDCKRFLKKHYGIKHITTDPITGEREWELKSQGKYSLNEMIDLIDRSDTFLRHDLGCDFPTIKEWEEMSLEERNKYKAQLRQ